MLSGARSGLGRGVVATRGGGQAEGVVGGRPAGCQRQFQLAAGDLAEQWHVCLRRGLLWTCGRALGSTFKGEHGWRLPSKHAESSTSCGSFVGGWRGGWVEENCVGVCWKM